MLTKDLIRYTTANDTITPEFIDPADPSLIAVAEQLLSVFETGAGKTREELSKESRLVIDSAPCPAIVARGLEKLLLDRTEFDTDSNDERFQFRQDLFARTSQLLSNEIFESLEGYQGRVGIEFNQSPQALADELYSDLPAYQQVIDFAPLSANRLLHRYNCAQVQGLLFHCDQVTLKIPDAPTGSLRQLFKYLRFRQLLATITKDTEGAFWIAVDGPLNLFYQTRKYGINLANFFTAVLHQEKWELRASIHVRQRSYQLALSDDCGILPDASHFVTYIPREMQLFLDIFDEKAVGWRIETGSHFVPLEGEFYCFPDYTLCHVSGVQIAMELFHPWHASHLTVRLQQLADTNKPPLILGVSRVLLKNSLVEGAIEASDYFSHFGFVFRQVPTMSQILPILNRLAGNTPERPATSEIKGL